MRTLKNGIPSRYDASMITLNVYRDAGLARGSSVFHLPTLDAENERHDQARRRRAAKDTVPLDTSCLVTPAIRAI